MANFGLLGRNIDYSFSKGFFGEKFAHENRSDTYVNLDFQSIEEFIRWFNAHNDLQGFNVTIPYKEAIIPFLDALDPIAQAIGAVNTVVVQKNSGAKALLKGYNTDYLGFSQSLKSWFISKQKQALILGTGGASKAVVFALKAEGFEILQVSRKNKSDGLKVQNPEETISYEALTPELIKESPLIVNCTPLGTFPNIEQAPELPYHALGPEHFLYDLIYNPEETEFLRRGRNGGTKVKNGLEMLELQALAAWELWQKG